MEKNGRGAYHQVRVYAGACQFDSEAVTSRKKVVP